MVGVPQRGVALQDLFKNSNQEQLNQVRQQMQSLAIQREREDTSSPVTAITVDKKGT